MTPVKKYHLATVTIPDGEAYRAQLEKRLHTCLHPKLEVTRRGKKIYVHITGAYTKPSLRRLELRIKRISQFAAPPRTERELRAMLRSVVKETAAMSPEEVAETIKHAGIITKSGKLSRRYGG